MPISKELAPSIPGNMQKRLKNFDSALYAVFNCERERFEILRFSRGKYHWVLAVENDDGSFRPLDERIFKDLHRMDIISRYGSIANYERYMDEKQKKYRENIQKEQNHQMRCDIKDDWPLWQKAAEEARSGRINSPPEQESRKIISCPN